MPTARTLARVALFGVATLIGIPGPASGAPGSESSGSDTARLGEPLLEISLGRGADTLSVAAGQRRVCLDHRPIFIGSLDVTRDGRRLVLGVDYSADENSGCFELFQPSPDSLQLIATYRYVPLSSSMSYRLRDPVSLDAVEVAPAGIGPGSPQATDGARLLVGGSKTFVVEVGSNQDAVLRQTLDLTLRGRLTRDVEVQAVLSDRDSPVTPEGTSAELEELDKVFIQINSRTARATFGHIDVAQDRGEFARYQRRLEGVEVQQAGEHILAGGVAANARGLFRSVEFFGSEGIQGPYVIGAVAGVGRVAIVPGSEEVTLDGVKLRRGQDRDYTIDYALGEITFTPQRPVTFDSRITLDYEEEAGDYRRRFMATDGGYTDADGFRARAFLISESDDRSAPRGFSLGSEEEALLQSVGDNDPVGEAFASREVEPGEGDYVLIGADENAPSHFEWVGEGFGNYLVSFIRVGRNLGAYSDSTLAGGDLIFVFVGSGGGDFDPGRRLARPEQHTVADLQLDWEGERGSFRGEIAGSRHDLNTFSAIDDADNEGLAGNAELFLQGPQWNTNKGGISVTGRWRHLDREFSPFSRVNPSFDFLDWNYTPDGLTEGEDRGVVALGFSPGDGGTVTLETGRLQSGDAFSADRVVADYRRTGRLASILRWEKTWSEEEGLVDGLREVRSAQSTVRLGFLRPTARYRSEMTLRSDPEEFSGQRFESIGGGGRVDLPGPLAATVDVTRRIDQLRAVRSGEDEWATSSETLDRSAELELRRFSGLSGRASYRRRTFEPAGAASAQETDLARLALTADPTGGLYRAQLDYQVTTESAFSRSKMISFVGDGRGNYDSLGVFVGTGDYDVTITQSDSPERLSRLDLALRATLFGRSSADAAAFWRYVRATTFVRIGQSSRLPFRELANPLQGLDTSDDATVEGNLVLRQEATLFPNGRLSPRVRWERVRNLDGRFDNVRELSEDDIVTLRLRGTPTKTVSIGLEGGYEVERDVVERRTPTVAREEDRFTTRTFAGDITSRPKPDWTSTIEVTLSRTEAPTTLVPETRLEISPVATWTPRRAGRVEARFRWVQVRDPLARRRPIFDFGLTSTSGTEWSTVADYRLKEFLTLGGTLRAVRPEGEETRYDGRMELRAFF